MDSIFVIINLSALNSFRQIADGGDREKIQSLLSIDFVKQLNEILINGNYGDFVMNPDSPAIVEYLGEDYPLYFDDNSIIDDNFISNKRIIDTYNYLCNFNNSDFFGRGF